MEQVYVFSLLFFVIYVTSTRGQQEQFSFPPINSLQSPDITSDKYFSSQFQSQIPYFVTNSYNEISKKSIPPHIEKLSNNISPMPMLLVSTAYYGDENLRRKDEIKRHINISAMPFNYNRTKHANKYEPEEKTSSTTSHLINYQHPIERMDTKASISPETLHFTANQNPVSKKMIISIENGNNQELEQKASFHNVNFAPTPKYFLQSTTEPAIPILRLSNEMDLDGSFSYEALGADQTHYVQHSRMENIGTDKEGPIVEGSYSYVGDNGQTYTVHYIADSNGYRATGDHLPVPPPIPEIIQRSIQYNLAQEIKQEPHLQYYVSDSIPDNEKYNQNYIRTQRNLFTGQTPESFSFGFLQAASSLRNNVTSLKNVTDPSKTSPEFPQDNTKRNINYEPLEPQVTFRALQGAHSPLNDVQKPTLPQLVNYEPNVKETESAKALWRWQYGLNSNTDKPNTIKDSISRSSSEGDDIIINFNEMSPEEYTKIIKDYEKIDSNSNYNLRNEQEMENSPGYTHFNKNMEINDGYESLENKKYYSDNYNDVKPTINTVNDYMLRNFIIANSTRHDNYNLNYSQMNNEMKPKVMVVENNVNPVSSSSENSLSWFDDNNKSYDSKGTMYDPIKTTNQKINTRNYNIQTIPITSEIKTLNNENNELKIKSNYETPTVNPISYGNNIQYQGKYEFKTVNENLLNQILTKINNTQYVTTPESTIQEEMKNNIFLKNILMANDHDSRKLDHEKIKNTEKLLETVTRSSPINTFNYEANSRKEVDPVVSKAFDISNVLNLIDNKNIFESNRLLIKRKPQYINNVHKYNFDADSNFENINKEKDDPNLNVYNTKQHPQQQEIRGNLKNYKVLQRNNARNFNTEDNPSQHHLNKSIYSLKLPPLGRAGPSMKTYQPPLYLL